jgi:predicted SAM-dependent methyltransferase
MRKIIKKLLGGTPLESPAKKLQTQIRRVRREIAGTDEKIIREYLKQQKTRKLHLGCGAHVLDGWLNTNVFTESHLVARMDATKPYPLDDDAFDYAFSEHMVEHISHEQGEQMFKECFRVLRDKGTIRITTPDLSFLIDLYRSDKTDLQKKYIRWAAETLGQRVPFPEDTFVINNFVRDWGHVFIYDEKTLRASLERAGFKKIVRCNLNESDHEALHDLENEEKMPEGFLKLESLSVEGTKRAPADDPGAEASNFGVAIQSISI